MSIVAITTQPAADALTAAYRPIVFRVKALKTGSTTEPPPVVYCDIYFTLGYAITIGGVLTAQNYYKTLTRTKAIKSVGTDFFFEFDIQDACQEVLSKEMPVMNDGEIFKPRFAYNKVQCYFRSSGIDASGFTVPEDLTPVMPTGDSTESNTNSGTDSNEFFVLNNTLRHEENQSLADHLSYYKFGTWKNGYYPVTHRPQMYYVTAKDNEHFPFFIQSVVRIKTMKLLYRFINQSTIWSTTIAIPSIWGDPDTEVPGFIFEGNGLLYIPSGPKNLQPLFPVLNFTDIAEYSVQLIEDDTAPGVPGPVAIQTPWHVILLTDERFRIRFLNYLGTYDAINFVLASTIHESKSDQTQRPTSQPLDKTQHSISRFNVKSNDVWNVVSPTYDETAQGWIDELMDSPCAWMEMDGIEGQNPYYLPIVITDRKSEKRKQEDRYVYELTLEFKLSNERTIIRN